MSGIVKSVTKTVRNVGRSVRKTFVPDKVDKAVFGTAANLDDVVRGKTPDAVREQERAFADQEKKTIERLEGEAKKKAVRKSTATAKLRASSVRARRAGRRSLMTAGRLGPSGDGKETLG